MIFVYTRYGYAEMDLTQFKEFQNDGVIKEVKEEDEEDVKEDEKPKEDKKEGEEPD